MKWLSLLMLSSSSLALIAGQYEESGPTDISDVKVVKCPQGQTSIHGVPGIPGVPGAHGVRGNAGPKGDKGDQGPAGPKGFHGQQGSVGPAGPTGPQGVQGHLGPAGPPGPVGSAGPPGPRGQPGTPANNVGITYTRWGSTSCPAGAIKVYSGRAGGNHWNLRGGGSNPLCMPDDPEYGLAYRVGVQNHSPVGGAEYEQPVVSGRHNRNVPCTVCYVQNRAATIMIPARMNCYSGWTREYYGYLMSSKADNRHYRTQFICMDSNMDAIQGLPEDTNGVVFYHTEASCNGLQCDRYSTEKELNCVVCSK